MALSNDNSTDRHLVNLVLKGDQRAFVDIISATERLVTQIVCKMVRGGEDRKDIAQDVYLKAYKGLGKFNFRSNLSTWIARIAYNTCLNHLEKRKELLTGDIGEEKDWLTDEAVAGPGLSGYAAPAAHHFLQDKQRSQIIQQATESLPPLHKTLITLYHSEELSYEEIAAITDLPIGTVKSYLFRARKTMKNFLLRHYKKEEL